MARRGLAVVTFALVALAVIAVPGYSRHRPPDPNAKVISNGYCYEIKAEGSIWTLQDGTCGDIKTYVIKYFHGTTRRCHQPSRNRVVCHLPGGSIASVTRHHHRRANARMARSPRIKECGNYSYDYGRWTNGGTGVGAAIVNVTTRQVQCRAARRFVMHEQRNRRKYYRGFTCRRKSWSAEGEDVRCTASRGRVIHWQWFA
jgi:hypothetical protein